MRAGRLDRRITITRAPLVDDGFATIEGDFAPLMTIWAQYLPGTGVERTEQAERAASTIATFRIRWSPAAAGITPKDRLVFHGIDFDIFSAAELGRRDGIEIKAVARSDGGQ